MFWISPLQAGSVQPIDRDLKGSGDSLHLCIPNAEARHGMGSDDSDLRATLGPSLFVAGWSGRCLLHPAALPLSVLDWHGPD